MLILNPTTIRFDTLVWEDASALAVDRAANKTTIEHSDLGPHATFADVPEQRTLIKITRQLIRADPASPIPGQQGELVFYLSPTASDARLRRVRAAQCVVLEVKHSLPTPAAPSRNAQRAPVTQTISLIALSTDGAADPLEITDAVNVAA